MLINHVFLLLFYANKQTNERKKLYHQKTNSEDRYGVGGKNISIFISIRLNIRKTHTHTLINQFKFSRHLFFGLWHPFWYKLFFLFYADSDCLSVIYFIHSLYSFRQTKNRKVSVQKETFPKKKNKISF